MLHFCFRSLLRQGLTYLDGCFPLCVKDLAPGFQNGIPLGSCSMLLKNSVPLTIGSAGRLVLEAPPDALIGYALLYFLLQESFNPGPWDQLWDLRRRWATMTWTAFCIWTLSVNPPYAILNGVPSIQESGGHFRVKFKMIWANCTFSNCANSSSAHRGLSCLADFLCCGCWAASRYMVWGCWTTGSPWTYQTLTRKQRSLFGCLFCVCFFVIVFRSDLN